MPASLPPPRRPASPLHRRPRAAAAALTVAAALLLGACAPEVQTRGNEPAPSSLEQVQVGHSSRAEVASLLGTPSTTSLFDGGESWFYISAKTQQYAFYAPEELERKVLMVQFDGRGVVKEIRTLGKEDGTELTMVGRTTPTAGTEMSVIEQLLGNIGRFSGGDGRKSPTSIGR